ncbi:MAG: hypothetical protein M3Z04_25465 [Chloroflexota bacterium]|nr:hypothetical protein [Chloroflexota bacterium]
MSAVVLPDSEEEEYRQLWRDTLREKHGSEAVTVELRLTEAAALIQAVEEGAVRYHGRWYHINAAHFDPTSTAALRAGGSVARSPARVIGIAVAVIVLLGGGLIAWIDGSKRSPVAALTTATVTVTVVTAGSSPTPLLAVAPTAGDPLRLDVAGHSFPIRSGAVVAGTWQVQPGADHLTWLVGATTNWAFFLDASAPAAAPLHSWATQLTAGTPLTLTLAGAPAHHFQVTGRARPGQADQVTILGPQQAGFTLGIRTGSSDDALLLLQGREPAAAGPTSP